MDYTFVLSELQKASSFDLFRLQSAINHLLDDPTRIQAQKRQLTVGSSISYFDSKQNRLVMANLLEVRKTRAVVADLDSGKRWTIPFYMINIEGAETQIDPGKKGLDRLSLQVGQSVSFYGRDGEMVYGQITKLNPKRDKIKTDRGIWTVPYSMLFSVIDGEQAQEQLSILDGEVVKS